MGTIFVDNLEPQSGTSLTLGASGDTIGLASGASQTLAVNTPSFLAYVSTGQTISGATQTVLACNTELYDTGSCYDTSTYKFTPNVAGKYMLMAKWRQEVQGVSNFQIRIEKNEQDTSSYTYPNVIYQNDRPFNYDQTYTGGILEANGSSDNFRVRVYSDSAGSISASFGTYFAGYKLIGA
jgi:hypothetical protein|tara:strand:+ start:226 stop:768 length:543 start_codon:yes stop_codon:yes gene_type:complete